MDCPQCGLANPPGTSLCQSCSTPLPDSDRTLTLTPVSGSLAAQDSERTVEDASGWSLPADQSAAPGLPGTLRPGRLLGNRYEILQLLGQGGMGAVYKARDRELDRLVALKVIRPELAQNAEILRRFKQELILARQVTHRNVIRIFDLGEADGIKFITMEFVDGRDLKTQLHDSGKFEPRRAAEIAAQICQALEAAHAEGVIHRDLKPQNVMVDTRGKVTVMDFGIARSMEAAGGTTQTGGLVGTPEYMSPEQVMGEKLDARTDLFSFGIILYELLTGDSPYKADTAMAALYKRTRETARPPIELNAGIPYAINDVVVGCLQIERDKRYASASDVLRDLEIALGTRSGTVALPFRHQPQGMGLRRNKKIAATIAAAVVALSLLVFYAAKRGFGDLAKTASPGPLVSLAILPFGNASRDQNLDWLGSSFADMLSTDVGQSSHLRVVSSGRLRQILRDLQLSPDSFADAANLGRLATMSGADTVVWGTYAKAGDGFRIQATLRDLKRDRSIPLSAEASNQSDLLPAVDRLAQTIRDNLSLQPNILAELKAQSFKPTSKSVDALRLYSEGATLAQQGKSLEAVKRFQAATEADPDFALAYAKLGETYGNLGYDAEAALASRKAVQLAQNLPVREKYLITANYARVEHDYTKAIEYYENLAASSPDDPEIELDLARLYEDTGTFDKARALYSKVSQTDPDNVDALLASGRVELRTSNPQDALAYFSRALSLANQAGNDEAKGTILQGMGVCYRQLGKRDEALNDFQQALDTRRRLGDRRGTAVTLNVIAQIQDENGKSEAALKSYQEALSIRRDIGDKRGLGDTLLGLGGFYQDRGRYDEALSLFKQALQVQRDLGSESNQGICLNDIGLSYLSKGDYDNALTYFQQALDLRQKSQVPQDIAFAVHNLAVTSEKLGQYDKALAYYIRALDLYRSAGDKQSSAMDSYGMGVLFGYQGRFGAAINAKQEALKSFTDLQDRTYWMTEVMSGYGKALADAGRFDEAQKPLADSLTLARQLKIDGSIAQALDFQGEALFYSGDLAGARSLYNQALQSALRSKEQEKILLTKFHLAQLTVKEGKAFEGASALRKLAREANSLGMKYVGFEASVTLGAALVTLKDYRQAQQELERVSAGAEPLELRPTLAGAHYWLATALRLNGHATQAVLHYRQALDYLDQIQKDTGSDAFLARADLKPISSDAARYSQ